MLGGGDRASEREQPAAGIRRHLLKRGLRFIVGHRQQSRVFSSANPVSDLMHQQLRLQRAAPTFMQKF